MDLRNGHFKLHLLRIHGEANALDLGRNREDFGVFIHVDELLEHFVLKRQGADFLHAQNRLKGAVIVANLVVGVGEMVPIDSEFEAIDARGEVVALFDKGHIHILPRRDQRPNHFRRIGHLLSLSRPGRRDEDGQRK